MRTLHYPGIKQNSETQSSILQFRNRQISVSAYQGLPIEAQSYYPRPDFRTYYFVH